MPTLLGRGRPSDRSRSPYPRAGSASSLPRPWRLDARQLSVLGGALAAAATLAAVLTAGRLYTRLEVEGLSMVPELAPGDRVIVRRTRQVAIGDVVALEDPTDPARYLVKRVVGLEHRAVRVEGDNAGASTDSRHFGPVPTSRILGRVVRRYRSAPRARSFGAASAQ